MFFRENDVIIDPSYPNLAAYRKKYDYDLLGHPIGLGRDFLRNPVGYVRQQLHAYRVLIFFACLYIIAFIVCVYLLKLLSCKSLRFLKTFLKMRSESKSAKSQNKKRLAYGQPVRLDLNALAFYRTFASHYNLHSGNSAALLPDDEEDYEDLRFALEAAWPTGLGLKALDEDYSPSEIDDEPIEGQLQDEVLEDYLSKIHVQIAKERARYSYRRPDEEQKVVQPTVISKPTPHDELGSQEDHSLGNDDEVSGGDESFDVLYDYDEKDDEWGFIYKRKSMLRFSQRHDDKLKVAVETEYQNALQHMYEEEDSLVCDELPMSWRDALKKAEVDENIGDVGLRSDYADTREDEDLQVREIPEETGLEAEVREARRRIKGQRSGGENWHNQEYSSRGQRKKVKFDVHQRKAGND